MDIFQFIVVAAVSTLAVGIGVVALQRNSRSRTNRTFFATTVLLTGWLVLNFMTDQPAFRDQALLLNQLNVALAIVAAASVFDFGATYPYAALRLTWTWRILLGLSVPLVVLSFTPWMIRDISFMSWGTNLVTGPVFPLVVAWCLICLVLLTVTLVRNYRRADAHERMQLKYLYVGLVLFGVTALLSSGILPVLTGTNPYARFLPYSALAFLAPTAYAIVRHRLMDLSLVALRGAAYTFVVGVAAALLVLLADWGHDYLAERLGMHSYFVLFVASLTAILTLQPVRAHLEAFADRYWYRMSYNPGEVLRHLSEKVAATLDIDEMARLLADELVSEMKLTFVAVATRRTSRDDVVTAGRSVPCGDVTRVLDELRGGEIVVVDELGSEEPLSRPLCSADVRVALPLAVDGALVGAVFLGAKESGRMFTEQDVNFLTVLASQVAVSLRNARLFDERNQRVRELVALSDLAKTLSADIGLQRVIDAALPEVTTVTGADSGSIMLLDKQTKTLSIAASTGLDDNVVERTEVRIGEGISGWVASSRKALVLVDKNDPRLANSGNRGEVGSAISAPIIYNDQVIGVINLNRHGGSEPFSSENLNVVTSFAGQLAVAIENARLYDHLENTFIGTIAALAAAVDAKDPHTYGHSNEVTEHAVQMAEKLELTEQEVHTIRLAALLHDIGKIGIDGALLNKPGKLTEEERLALNQHPTIGADILAPLSFLNDVVPLILFHHERPDGAGYPSGISGPAIPLGARIIAIADSYNAMISDRPYRMGLSKPAARQEIVDNAGTQFDAGLVEIFLEIIDAES